MDSFRNKAINLNSVMEHRHLIESSDLSLAAIDDIIDRGGRQAWLALDRRARADSRILAKIARVCAAHVADPYAQRYHFWNNYVRATLT